MTSRETSNLIAIHNLKRCTREIENQVRADIFFCLPKKEFSMSCSGLYLLSKLDRRYQIIYIGRGGTREE